MNTTFKAKFLQHLNEKRQAKGEKGFTLIELLVVIIIIGILAAIALPSFLNQANKAKQSEAKQYVSSVNKTQQAWFTEKGEFLVDGTEKDIFGSLGVGIETQTTNYKYEVEGTKAEKAIALAKPHNKKALKAYSGTVALVGTGEKTAQAKVCGTKSTDQDPVAASGTDQLKCDGTMEDL